MNYTPDQLIFDLSKLGIRQVLPPETIIYKYVSLNTAFQILENNSLLFSPPTSFNDPFELTNALIDPTFTDEDLTKWLDTFNNKELSSETRDKIYADNLNNPDIFLESFKNMQEQFKTIAGITCFSKSYKKTIMWSHYADKHAGVCLGFNIVPIGIKNFLVLQVNYIDQIVALKYFENKKTALLYWLFTKSKIWEYEEEVRAVFLFNNGLINFDKNLLKEVHFGLRTTSPQRNDFYQKSLKLGFQIDKMTAMEMDPTHYDLKSVKFSPHFS